LYDLQRIKELLDREAEKRNEEGEVTFDKPDPILVAKRYKEEFISLICSLFAYGNANQIVKFLSSLDFSLLDRDEDTIRKELSNFYYRFQNPKDVTEFFVTLKRIKEKTSLKELFLKGYEKERKTIDGIKNIIETIYETNPYSSKGYVFLIGKIPQKKITSPYKRWNMFLRWMVREDNIDFGLWKEVDKKDLVIPLDTHTFNVSLKLNLLKRKTYDYKAALELTETLKKFDPEDPVKYDFALYRIGQEKIELIS